MIAGLLLALASAALINIGFLLQHRGLSRHAATGLPARMRAAIRDRTWLAGQALGWVGFVTQIVAVAIAPLSLVQAFAAGGLGLSVPLAAWLFHHRITRAQGFAVLAIAAGLAVLPIGFSTARDHLHADTLTIAVAVGAALGLTTGAIRASWARAIAAGFFYGIADAAIKALSLRWHVQGADALVSGWTVVAALGTFGGFLAFQSALGHEGAVAAISLMNALAALVALACGVLAFAEALGRGAGAVVAHLLAIGVVLGCVPVLAAVQAALVESDDGEPGNDAGERSPTGSSAAAAVPGPR